VSEYQYYEFRAIDRPLDKREMTALREITSRATITPTSLVNEYHWGDFKGNPAKLMDKYFDAHLYFANWRTRQLMLRLPIRSFDLDAARPYFVPDLFTAWKTKEHIVFDWCSNTEDYDYYEGDEEGEGSALASLILLRSELMAGDLRCLYLGWLLAVGQEMVDEDAPEPPVPPGLRRLSGPLQSFVDFFGVDANLLDIAAAASGKEAVAGPSPEALREWIVTLPAPDKDEFLLRLMQGEGMPLAGELLQRFHHDQAPLRASLRMSATNTATRTVGELLEARDHRAEEQRRLAEQRAAQERERQACEMAAARARHLDSLVGKEDKLWRQVEEAIAKRQSKEYDRAVELLQDLRDLAERTGAGETISQGVRQLRMRHAAKPTLIQRLNRAGLPK
jgi:hypothetical protein